MSKTFASWEQPLCALMSPNLFVCTCIFNAKQICVFDILYIGVTLILPKNNNGRYFKKRGCHSNVCKCTPTILKMRSKWKGGRIIWCNINFYSHPFGLRWSPCVCGFPSRVLNKVFEGKNIGGFCKNMICVVIPFTAPGRQGTACPNPRVRSLWHRKHLYPIE